MEDKIKQVIVMRKDLNMRRGKQMAQASHASMLFIIKAIEACSQVFDILSDVQIEWMFNDVFTKIVVGVDDEISLIQIAARAEELGVACHEVHDRGLTEFHGVRTFTCLALGPDYSSKIDPITKDLTLL